MEVWYRARVGRPPITADRSTLASTASFTACLFPAVKILENRFFGNAFFLELPADFGAKHGKQFAFEIDRQGRFVPGQKNSSNFPPPSYQDWIVGAKQCCGAIAEVAYAADPHVVTRVTIIPKLVRSLRFLGAASTAMLWPPHAVPPCSRSYRRHGRDFPAGSRRPWAVRLC